jgi:peptidoglycan DL-endopeptidase CwlO
MAGRMRSRLRLLALVVAVPALLWALLPVGSLADSSPGQIQKEINRKQSLIGGHKAHERVLTTDITAYSNRIHSLQTTIDRLSAREQTLQVSLNAKRARLAEIQTNLRAERARLARLRARLLQAQHVLALRLVQIYKAGNPDLIAVVLNSHGFQDLLERTEFIKRISEQDAHIISIVKSAKADATTTAAKLGTLQVQAAHVTAQVQAARDQVSTTRDGLVSQRQSIQTVRARKTALLRSSRDRRQKLQDDVTHLVAAQAKIQAKLAGAGAGLPAGPIKQGSGGLIWPVNGPITSPFCERRAWEACHPGIDIGVPEGTPIRAAAAGRVALMEPVSASGGYGNYTCIQHTATFSTCYAHQSRFATSVGAQVAQGQIIGYTGCTGLCFGPHLHFETRVNGSVVNPMNYL